MKYILFLALLFTTSIQAQLVNRNGVMVTTSNLKDSVGIGTQAASFVLRTTSAGLPTFGYIDSTHFGPGVFRTQVQAVSPAAPLTIPLNAYKGFITQTGSGVPSFTSVVNTIGGTWARSSTGTYTLTQSAAFTLNKTVPFSDIFTDGLGNLYRIDRTNANVITLRTYAAADTSILADDVLSNWFINIEIYQ